MKTGRGKFPRQFALGASGLLVAVLMLRPGLQDDQRVALNPTPLHANGGSAQKTSVAPFSHLKKIPALIGMDRAEIVRALRSSFRRDQIGVELAIEQRRYGRDYWQTEKDGRQLRELDRVRSVQLDRLAREMNALLGQLCGDAAGESMTLAPIFDSAHPGPNLSFLSAESRAKVEELIAEQWMEDISDSAGLLSKIETVLTGTEMAHYREWNSPEHARLRNQLVGFNATKNEFNAIAQWPGFVNQGNSPSGDDEPAMIRLAAEIGVQRVADLIRLRDPEIQTAVHDLHRLGLPVDQAESLAALRSQGIGEIEQTWMDPAVSPAMKELRVRQLLDDYRTRIAATFQIAANSPEQTDLLP